MLVYIPVCTGNSPYEGYTGLKPIGFSNKEDCLFYIEREGNPYLQACSFTIYDELPSKAKMAELEVRTAALAKLTEEEKKALGLDEPS